MEQLVNAINAMNEREIKYRMETEGAEASIVFGIMIKGEKCKGLLIPSEDNLVVKVSDKERTLEPEELEGFLDGMLELRAIQEQEDKLFASLLG